MATAQTAFRGIDDPTWWQAVKADDVALTYQTALSWRDLDPDARLAFDRIVGELHRSYDIDVDQDLKRHLEP